MGEAIGFVETRGLVAAIEAADSMLKVASVKIIELKVIGSGLVSVMIAGEVAAVQAAVDIGKARAALIGEVISVNVIPRPDDGLYEILN